MAIWYYRAMGLQVDATSWERKKSGQSCTVGVFLSGEFSEFGLVVFFLLEKGLYMNLVHEMLKIH